MIPTAKKPPHIMSVRSRACCVKPLEHIIHAIITFSCSEEHEWETKNGGSQWKWGKYNNKAGCTLAQDQTVQWECLLITFLWNTLRALECSRKKTDWLSCFKHIVDTVAYVPWLWFMFSMHIVSVLCTINSSPEQWIFCIHKSMNRCWPKHLT